MSVDDRCRACGNPGMTVVLSLGLTPLANCLLRSDQLLLPEPKYALDLAFCDPCGLAQIKELVPREQLFRDYLYF